MKSVTTAGDEEKWVAPVTDEEAMHMFHECDDQACPEELTGQGRWNTYKRRVFKLSDGSFYAIEASQGSTECQDYDGHVLTRGPVKPVQKTVTVYE